MDRRFLQDPDNKKYKLILVGDSNVGKTALFWRYTQGDFQEHKSTEVTTVDFKMKTLNIDKQQIKLYIWDTAGQQKYRSIVSTYFKGCHGAFLIFDVSKPESFEHIVQQWYELCRSRAPDCTIFLIGNKNDLSPSVNQQQINKFCKEKKIKYYPTSAKTGMNVSQIYEELVRKLVQKQQPQKTISFALDAQNFSNNNSKSCC